MTFGLGHPKTLHLIVADAPALAVNVASGRHEMSGAEAGRTFSDVVAEVDTQELLYNGLLIDDS